MGNKNKHNRKNNNKNGHPSEPPSPFEVNAENVPPISDEIIEDPNKEKLKELYPWRSPSQTNEERKEEIHLRLAASSLLSYSDTSSILPLLKKIASHRDNIDPSIPVIPPLLIGTLTKIFVNRININNNNRFPFDKLPPNIQQYIGRLSGSMPELRLTSRTILKAVTHDMNDEWDATLKQLNQVASSRNLFLDRAKIRKNRLFDSNWFGPEYILLYQMEFVEGKIPVGCCNDINMEYYLMRRSDCGMDKGADIRWFSNLNNKGLPLWVYGTIKPRFSFKFKAGYEPGDEIIVRASLVTRKLRKVIHTCPSAHTKTRLNQHVMQYELIWSTMPSPVLTDTSHAGPLDLCLHLNIPAKRDDIVIYDIDIRCSLD